MIIPSNPFNQEAYPNTYEAYQYAEQVVRGEIIACVYIIGACKRFIDDLDKKEYPFDPEKSERYLKLTQLFQHVKGSSWKTDNITYEPWQKFVFANIMGFINPITKNRRYRTAHLEIARGQGKALCLETKIPTPDRGLINFSEINIGDSLYSSSGQICRVVGKTPIHFPKAYRVTFSDGTTVDCSSNHLWVTSSKSEREREKDHKRRPPKRLDKQGNLVGNFSYNSVRTTEEIFNTLKIRGESNYSVKVCESVVGTREDCQLPYILGYWLGNGDSNQARFSCHINHFEEIEARFKSSRVFVEKGEVKGNGVSFKARGLTFWLKELGVLKNKHIPEKYFLSDEKYRRELLRGLMDSDGTINKTDRSFVFCSSQEEFARQVRRLIASLGYKVSFTSKVSRAQNEFEGIAFYVTFSTPNTRPAIFGLRAKEDRRPIGRAVYYCDKRYITSVEKILPKPMFCIEVDSPDHTFLITDQYITTHNSAMASQMALYFLALDNPKGNEISCVATKTEQARIVLDSARAMAKSNPQYLKATGVEVLAHKIVHEKSNSVVRALSSDDKSLDGLNDILAICDELHAQSRELFEVISSGMSKRSDSLLLCITTAGFSTDSVGYEQSVYAKKVAKGEVKDDSFFSAVYTIDEGDDIFSEDTWKKANPNYGISVDPITFKAKAEKAKVTPSDIPNFKVKHLDCWISESNAFYDVGLWNKACDDTLSLDQFYGEKCYVGIDLASKIDLTSFALLFRKDGIYYYFDKTFIPEETFNKARSAVYENAQSSGNLIITPGEAIHYPKLEQEFISISKDFNIISGLFDPWNAVQFAQNMVKERIDMKEFRMTTANLSEATKTLDALIRQGKIKHNGSPLTSWCLGNVVAKEDSAGNVFPRKSSDKLKIDPIVSLIMALAAWMQEDNEDSVYESRGPLFL